MHYFHYEKDELFCEEVPLRKICQQVGTPVFVYSRATLERHFQVFRAPFLSVDHVICYSMKACSNLAILRVFANLGGGLDIVSGGELYRALKAGIDPAKIVYSGVGKTAAEMDSALSANIMLFNVESEEELVVLDKRARSAGKKARVALRVNPDVDPKTHPKISTGLRKNKFGIDSSVAIDLYRRARDMRGVDPVGVDCHIGSQLTELSPFLEAADKLVEMIRGLRADGIEIKYLDVGGGLGIPYDREEPPTPAEYGEAVIDRVKDLGVTLILEPGRLLVGNAGVMATRVLYRKKGPVKSFVIVDAAMNDLIRPTLYEAHHSIWSVDKREPGDTVGTVTADLVGPICETGDFLAQAREIGAVEQGDLLAIMSAGAYGFSMASNYNSRPRAAEVLVDGNHYDIIRERETYEDLLRGERIPEALSH